MSPTGIDQRILDVRLQADRLVAQLGAVDAAPFLAAVAVLEQQLAEQAAERQAAATALQCAETECAQFQQALTNAPLGVCMFHGPEQHYTFTNPIYDQVGGRSDMVGHTVRELFPEIAGQGIYELLDGVYSTGEPFTARDMLIRFDRQGQGHVEDLYFDLTYLPVRAADDSIAGVVAYVLDTSDRLALEQERTRVLELTQAANHVAERERQRMLEVLQRAPAAICTLEGPEHVITFINPRYDQLVGRQGSLGLPVRMAVPEAEGQGFLKLLDAVYQTGTPFVGNEIPIQLARHGGALEQAFVNFVYAPLRDSTDTVTGIFVHAVEVTDLVAARQRAEDAVVVRDHFLSLAAHELKTPLTALIGYIQVIQRRLRQTKIDDRTDRTLTMIGAQGQRLNRLIDTLLDVARINMGHLSLELVPLDVGALAARVVDEMGIMLEQRAVQVAILPTPCLVPGDALRLEQVIMNLVQNAIKYSPEGGEIVLTVACSDTHATIEVRNQGYGIPVEALPHLFERFYRVREGMGQAIPGMGIGLSVVKEIVTLHGGTVSVESIQGEGSTFVVTLPRALPAEATPNP